MSENKTETMLSYIEECPDIIRNNTKDSKAITLDLVKEYTSFPYKTIWIVASGSSSNSAYCARYFMRRYLDCEVKVITPFTFIHAENNFTPDDFIFVISQSGYSSNTIEALQVIKNRGRKTISLTMDSNSDIKDYSDLLVNFNIGFEKIGFVTKGVTGLTLFLMLFALEASLTKDIISLDLYQDLKNQLDKSALVNQEVLKQTKEFYQDNFLSLVSIDKTYICGLGSGYGVALEGALKISETVQIPASACESEEYLHGITLQVTPKTTGFFIDTSLASDRIIEIYEANKLATNNTFLITLNSQYKDEKTALVVDTDIDSEILPLCFLPFFQYLAYQITEDTSRWEKHPSYKRLSEVIGGKTKNYSKRPS